MVATTISIQRQGPSTTLDSLHRPRSSCQPRRVSATEQCVRARRGGEFPDLASIAACSGQPPIADDERIRPRNGRARLGIERRLRHHGFVPQEIVPPLYRRAPGMAFPSLYENIPSPPLEAMASGCPVACSVRGSVGEAFGDTVAPIEPEDVHAIATTLVRVCTDEELRAQLQSAGSTLVRRFRWETTAERHEAVYRRTAALVAG